MDIQTLMQSSRVLCPLDRALLLQHAKDMEQDGQDELASILQSEVQERADAYAEHNAKQSPLLFRYQRTVNTARRHNRQCKESQEQRTWNEELDDISADIS